MERPPRQVDKHAFGISMCPAAECESRRVVHHIRRDDAPDVYERLEAVANGGEYDYYVCDGHCYRVWRAPKIEIGREPYRPPEWIGSWQRDQPGVPAIFDRPQKIILKSTYLPSRGDPFRPARDKTDATRLPRKKRRRS